MANTTRDYLEFRAPGRVNLIGEHTDYNDGFVMPVAIHLETTVRISADNSHEISVLSNLYKETVHWDMKNRPSRLGHWSDYVIGVIAALRDRGYKTSGAGLVIDSTIPQGAGLSSSAALEVGTALAWLSLANAHLAPLEMALLCQKVENEFVGVKSGVMDQFAVCHGREGHALLLDCRSLEFRYLPLPRTVSLLACNTLTRHSLAQGEYNRRREECTCATQQLGQFLPNVRSLRDVTLPQLMELEKKLDPLHFRRARHVASENARVLAAAAALERGDLSAVGQLMVGSHESLQHDYEVSTAELDSMVAACLSLDGVYGARMMGGGFGGCALALVEALRASDLAASVREAYVEKTGASCEIYLCQTANAASEVRAL